MPSEAVIQRRIEMVQKVARELFGYAAGPRAYQSQITEYQLRGEDVLAVLPTGGGKCLGRGTPVLMHDGSVRAVENVKTGDLLMGPDSRPRRVMGTTHGRAPMYCVRPSRGEPYHVNADHVLSLQSTGSGGDYPSTTAGRVVNISVRDWIAASRTFRRIHKGWRTGVEFAKKATDPALPPYLLGMWLGDGHTAGVLDDKHIPSAYLINDRATRLEVLAGMVDSDGHMTGRCIDIILKVERLAANTVFLARSLGFGANMRRCRKTCTNNGVTGDYFRIHITGDVTAVPCRLGRKRLVARATSTNTMRTAITVEPVGDGDYFGFEVDGDHLFLLGDFTVTHNSFCFQGPAIVRPGLTLVISPLVALMKDQVDKLRSLGVAADRITFDMPVAEQQRVFDRMPELDMIYVAPERCKNKGFMEALRRCRLGGFVVDEAHCLSKWGKEFRPSYAKLGDLRREFPTVPMAAFTATADKVVEADIARILCLRQYRRVVASPVRPNLTYRSSFDITPSTLADVVRAQLVHPGVALVYCATRAATEEIADELRNNGVRSVEHYHAGLERKVRTAVQDRFMAGDIRCMVSTNAFGMGVDKPDVRLVYHWHMPGTVFDYAQEAGRAGRDGQPSTCYLNVSKEGRRKRSYFILLQNPDLWVYEKLWRVLTRGGAVRRGEVNRVTKDYLAQALNLKSHVSAQMDSALAYLEFSGHIEMIPGPRVYRLPAKNPAMCRTFARRFRSVRISGHVVTVTCDPDEDDPVDEMVSAGAVQRRDPEESAMAKIKRDALGITEEDIIEKRAESERQVDKVVEFAETKDKDAYLERFFLAADKP